MSIPIPSKSSARLSTLILSITMAFTGIAYAQSYEMPEPVPHQEEPDEPELSQEELQERRAQQSFEENQPTDYSRRDLAYMLGDVPYFSHFLAGLEQTGLLNELDGEQTYTLFVPFDEAFERLPAGIMENWQSGNDAEGYRQFIARHIIEGEVTSESLGEDAQSFETLNGNEVEIRSIYGAIMAGPISVNMPDIETVQGYIHGMNGVLLTPTTEEPNVVEQ